MTCKQINPRLIKWFQKRLVGWFEIEGRHFSWRNKSASKYQIIIAEVLLQRTKAETIASFFPEFIKKYPTWKALSLAKLLELEKVLKPIGLWRQRSAVMRNLSNEMAKRNGRFPKTREEIEKLPGVGQYIANAILLFYWNQSQPLLDVNMARVLERFFGPRKLADIRYDPYLQDLARKVLPMKNTKEFNWANLDFAAMICKARKPLCQECPMNSKCYFYSQRKTQVNY
ncbi:hypothetical protein KAR91_86390 [Candidatus Pacearchaeota archaeon]|nr:hypothetical protein [Candidatus Pacearchaeota archaeon]